MLLFLHRQLVFMEQLMGKKFVLKTTVERDDFLDRENGSSR
jgi:hypothetical protein